MHMDKMICPNVSAIQRFYCTKISAFMQVVIETCSFLRDFKKFMEKDRHGLDSNVLRFVARMDTARPIDIDRRFIVFFHLSDDTIAVFEPPQRNSGESSPCNQDSSNWCIIYDPQCMYTFTI